MDRTYGHLVLLLLGRERSRIHHPADRAGFGSSALDRYPGPDDLVSARAISFVVFIPDLHVMGHHSNRFLDDQHRADYRCVSHGFGMEHPGLGRDRSDWLAIADAKSTGRPVVATPASSNAEGHGFERGPRRPQPRGRQPWPAAIGWKVADIADGRNHRRDLVSGHGGKAGSKPTG